MKTTSKNTVGSVVFLLAMMIVPLVTSGYEAVPQEALVGQWFNGPQDPKDHSGYTPSGTRDAVMPPNL